MSITYKIVNGDFQVSSATGRPLTVVDSIKFKQDLACNFTTQTRSNGFGAGLEELIGTVPLDTGVFTILAEQHLQNSFTAMIRLQKQYQQIPRPNTELLAAANGVYVSQDSTDFRQYRYSANIVTVAGQRLTANGTVI